MRRRWLVVVLTCLVCAGLIGYWRYCLWRDHRFDALILAAAQRYGVEPALAKAVVWRESRFHANARGSRQEFGLMQIREAAAGEWAQKEKIRGFTPEQLWDPATNTLAGTWYLARLLRRYQKTDRPMCYALADYNAGRTHVLADEIDHRISRHLLGNARRDRLAEAQFRHAAPPSLHTWRSISSTRAGAPWRASWVAASTFCWARVSISLTSASPMPAASSRSR